MCINPSIILNCLHCVSTFEESYSTQHVHAHLMKPLNTKAYFCTNAIIQNVIYSIFLSLLNAIVVFIACYFIFISPKNIKKSQRTYYFGTQYFFNLWFSLNFLIPTPIRSRLGPFFWKLLNPFQMFEGHILHPLIFCNLIMLSYLFF